jgi:tRNA/rRNA methyltransferase
MGFWVYMLWCGDDSIYTGQTDDLELRLAQHRSPDGAGYTHDHKSLKLIWCQEFPTRDDASIRERQIKGWTRRKKLSLARGDFEGLRKFSRAPQPGH